MLNYEDQILHQSLLAFEKPFHQVLRPFFQGFRLTLKAFLKGFLDIRGRGKFSLESLFQKTFEVRGELR